ncbi:MAG: thioredoxin [Clostridia bacterium]|nr:thioredoxin [Clostridia bacterium]MBR0491054.1 thioredoxin [Clostridia bacterium]
MSVLKISEENFEEEVMKSEKTVILDFYADWCGPCKMMSPIIDGVAEELGEEVKVGKVNTDENLELAQKFNIMSIPTIMIFKGGNVVKTFVGVTDKTELINAVK